MERGMQLYPHLTFDGGCGAAFAFYEECLHGKTVFLMTYENTPMKADLPAEWRKKVSHATFELDGFLFSGSDAPPGRYQKPQGFVLQLNLAELTEAERIFGALAQDGTVQVPFEETFWALRFGVVVDRFGIPWMINCERSG